MANDLDSILNVQAVPQDDRKAAFIAESKNNRNRCYEMSEQMTEKVATDGKAFQQYLDVQSKFDRYTANNVLLIMAQKPEAEKIGDYGYWKDKGVYVKRQERNNPILIMEPGKEYEREDGSIGTYYNAKKVYDITQTTMGRMIQPQPEGITDKQLLRALVSNPPATIVTAEPDQMPEGKGAFFEPEENCIYVRKGMDVQDIFRSLTPELALAGFADKDKNFERGEYMFYAYCASYMLCKKYGMDIQNFKFDDNVKEYFKGMEPQEVRAELSRIRDAASGILSRMAKKLEQERSQHRQSEHLPQPEQPEKAEQNSSSQPSGEWQQSEQHQSSQGYPMGRKSPQYTRGDNR